MISPSEARTQKRELLLAKEKILRQRLFKNDLYRLANLIGFCDLGNFHKDLCRRIVSTEGEYLRRLFLLPRGHFKTSIITQANSVRRILLNPNVRILIASSTLENAKNSVEVIKNVFRANEAFRNIFPEYSPPDGVKEFGTQLSFTVPNRSNMTLKEATVEGCGVGQTITGMHFDYIVLSDIVTPETVTTNQQIKNTNDWVAYAYSLLDVPERNTIDMEGTRYHFDDIYGSWEQKAKSNKAFFIYKRPALNERDEPLFPERFSKEGLKDIEAQQGSFIFAGQYLLEPIDEGTAPFKKDEIQFIPRQAIPRVKDNKYAYPFYCTLDAAVSEDKNADESVITISMFTPDNDEFVVAMEHGHWSPTTLAKNLFDIYDIYKPQQIAMEVVAFQKLFFNVFEEYQRKTGVILPIQELKRDSRLSKQMRIMGLQPRFQQRKIFFSDDLDQDYIRSQLLRFNPDKHHNKDDLLDTLADMDYIKQLPEEHRALNYDEALGRRWKWLRMEADEREEFESNDVDPFTEEETEETEYYAYGTNS